MTSTRILVSLTMAAALAAPALAEARQRTAPPGSTSSGTAVPRDPGPATSSPSSSSGSSTSTSSSSGGSTNPAPTATPRNRDGRPTEGTATPRTSAPPVYGYSFNPVWYDNYFGYSRYYRGYGYDYGYDPYWTFGSSRWLWGRYGLWGYDPYAQDPYAYYPGGGGSGSGYESRPSTFGSVRMRVSPGKAKIYIDGTLAGTVDDFSGLSHHLDLDSGTHQIELRAEGYETFTAKMDVSAGKTLTFRASMKEIKKDR